MEDNWNEELLEMFFEEGLEEGMSEEESYIYSKEKLLSY